MDYDYDLDELEPDPDYEYEPEEGVSIYLGGSAEVTFTPHDDLSQEDIEF